VVDGDGQVGTVGQTLPAPIVVEVRDDAGRALPDVEVRWRADGGGEVGEADPRTGPDGRATARWTLGPVAGEQAARATVDGIPAVALAALAAPGPPAALTVNPTRLRFEALGDTSRLSAVAADSFGNRIPEPSLHWRSTDTTVARVDSGLVTSRGDGSADIVVWTGAEAGPGDPPVSPSVTVPAEIRLPVAGVRIGSADLHTLTGDTLTLGAVALAAAGDTLARVIAWSSGDTAVATVEVNGRLTARAAGSTRVRAAAGDRADSIRVSVHTGSGARVPELAHYDSIIPAFMTETGLVGGAVAVARDGRLLLARGYGLADSATDRRVRPTSLFRIASVSKAIAAMTALRLAQQGRLDLDSAAFDHVRELAPDPLPDVDPRLDDITVRHLLSHAGGWDMATAFDPAYGTREIARILGVPAPASADDLVRYMWDQPLQFDPGTAFAYSNFGYILLARIIENAAGLPFEAAVREALLDPADISGMRLGRTRPADRAPDEVTYYAPGRTASVFPPHPTVPTPYGAFHLEAMDGSSGWIASVVDLARLISAIDGTGTPDLLDAATIDAMLDRPPLPDWDGRASYYGLGWWVQPFGGSRSWWSDGSFSGSTAIVVRAHSGVVWAAVFNGSVSTGHLSDILWQAHEATDEWPAHDLFDAYP
jgi:N-acyl-D-amino-acid deacylase